MHGGTAEGHRTYDRAVAGSAPCQTMLHSNPRQVVHIFLPLSLM